MSQYQTIPSDDSCQSPHHNEHTCKRCKEQKFYESAIYCPECCCYYIPDRNGTQQEVRAPEFTDVEKEVCNYCKAEALAEASDE